jgi:hypothetical protein
LSAGGAAITAGGAATAIGAMGIAYLSASIAVTDGAVIDNAISKVQSKVKKPYEYHHIVPQGASKTQGARDILYKVGIGINSPENIIILEYGKHRGIHTTAYYEHVNNIITSVYDPNASVFSNRLRVERALMELRREIMTGKW